MTIESPTKLPTGLVTFLITDIEGSTEILQAVGDDTFATTVERHNAILRDTLGEHGVVVHVTGDSFFAVFSDPIEAVKSAADAQRSLWAETWPTGVTMRVRMGMHTGHGQLGGEDYVGLDVHRAARISSAATGGQVLLSGETARRVTSRLPQGVSVLGLGSHRLKDLSQAEELYQLVVDGLPHEFGQVRAAPATPGNLPTIATAFLGRDRQVEEISSLLRSHRLVTLTGTGGAGKTRLSIEVAKRLGPTLSDGAFFVDLESLLDEGAIPAATLRALGQAPSSSVNPEEQLLATLADKDILLVLDNYEQLLPQAAFVSRMMRECDGLRVVVTSRAPLRLSGEQEYAVPPMSSPPASDDIDLGALMAFESVELFVNTARAVRPDFELTDENAAPIAALANRLDGLPLAIELAASRVRILSPGEILDRLSNRLLATGSSDLPKRQQTIANAVEWSYDLLDEPTQRFFERLSVFGGGATLNEITSVCAPDIELDVLDAVSSLVEQSLLESVTAGATSRYQMLVVVREFATEKLEARDDAERVRDRHLSAFADLAHRAEKFLLTSHQREWLDLLEIEYDNLAIAIDRAISLRSTDVARHLVADLWRFLQMRGHLQPGIAFARASLDLPDENPMARARALEALAGLLYWKGDWDEAVDPYLRALELAREHGDSMELANALFNASFAYQTTDDNQTALACLHESLEISTREGYPLGVGRALWGLCDISYLVSEPQQAISYGKQAEKVFEALDAPFDLGWTRFMIAHCSYRDGNYADARRYVDAGLPLFLEADDVSALTLVMYVKSGVCLAEGDSITAARLSGAVESITRATGVGIGEVPANQYLAVTELRSSDDPQIQAGIAEGRQLSIEEAIELAIES